jgi:hypothetical protein
MREIISLMSVTGKCVCPDPSFKALRIKDKVKYLGIVECT